MYVAVYDLVSVEVRAAWECAVGGAAFLAGSSAAVLYAAVSQVSDVVAVLGACHAERY